MNPTERRIRPRSIVRAMTASVAFVLIAVGCGDASDGEQAVDTSETTTTAAQPADTTVETSVAPTETEDPAGADDDPIDEASAPADAGPIILADGLPPALPIAETYEDDNWFWRLEGSENGLVAVNGIMVSVVRDGVLTDVSIQRPDLPKVEPVGMTVTDSHAVVIGSTTGWSGSVLATVEWDSLETNHRIDPVGPGTFTLRQTGFGSRTVGLLEGQLGVIDIESLTIEREIEVDWTRSQIAVEDEIWTVNDDGTVDVTDFVSGAPIGEVDLGRPVGPFQTWLLGHNDQSVYLASIVDGEAAKIDRATLSVDGWIDLTGHLEGASATILEADQFHVMLDVVTADGRWFVLSEFDPERDAVVASHRVAPNDDRAFRGTFDAAEFAWAQGQLYVQDHHRRIVRVDLGRWGTDTGTWIDPALPVEAVLKTDDELAVAQHTLDFLSPNAGGDIPRTDPALSAAALASVPENYDPDEPWVGAVDVVGDRAWVLAYLGSTSVPFLGFQRIDGVWTIDSMTECWILSEARFHSGCPVPEPTASS